MSKKKSTTVTLQVDFQRALEKFPFIKNENITLLEREDKSCSFSVCDGLEGNMNLCCYWDRHPIGGTVYKCPIRKIYSGERKSYKSSINGNTYSIQDNLNTDEFYYETDGNFCSVECCWSFLEAEEAQNPLYENSKQLITSILGREPKAAPHWRILKPYGGSQTIEKFREGFKYKEYRLDEVISGNYPFVYKFKEMYRV